MTPDWKGTLPVNHRLTITIPGAEKTQTTFHPTRAAAFDHLDARVKPKALGMPPPLPPGSEWRIVEMVETEIAKGKVPPKE